MSIVATALSKITRGPAACQDLDRDEAQALFAAMLGGTVSPVRAAALCVALRWKGETRDELIGFASALDAVTLRLPVPPNQSRLAVIPSYSPRHRQPNLMPMLALRLAGAGVPVLVHGALGGGAAPPSFAVFEALGYGVQRTLADAHDALAQRNLAIVPTGLLCPALDPLLDLRTELCMRHVGHLMARLIDPSPGFSLRLICSTDPAMLDRLADLITETGGEALLMRATDGEPYANPERRPRIAWFRQGEGAVLYDEDLFSGPASSSLDDPDDVTATAQLIQDMLDGRRPVPVPVANQLAACLYASGRARDLAHARAMVAIGFGRVTALRTI